MTGQGSKVTLRESVAPFFFFFFFPEPRRSEPSGLQRNLPSLRRQPQGPDCSGQAPRLKQVQHSKATGGGPSSGTPWHLLRTPRTLLIPLASFWNTYYVQGVIIDLGTGYSYDDPVGVGIVIASRQKRKTPENRSSVRLKGNPGT